MNTSDIRTALTRVMAEHPKLNRNGYGSHWSWENFRLSVEREALFSDHALEEIGISIDYLETLPLLSKYSRKWRGSYELKHSAENTVRGGYVANGSLIAAALILDIPIRVHRDSPNPDIAVGGERVERRF